MLRPMLRMFAVVYCGTAMAQPLDEGVHGPVVLPVGTILVQDCYREYGRMASVGDPKEWRIVAPMGICDTVRLSSMETDYLQLTRFVGEAMKWRRQLLEGNAIHAEGVPFEWPDGGPVDFHFMEPAYGYHEVVIDPHHGPCQQRRLTDDESYAKDLFEGLLDEGWGIWDAVDVIKRHHPGLVTEEFEAFLGL